MSRVDRFIPAGTKVCLNSLVNDDGTRSPEFGIVVHCWLDPDGLFNDCFVAFFGNEFPSGAPDEKPYILRYAAISLTVLDDD